MTSHLLSAMAVLEDLSDELLVVIVQFLACDEITLSSLAIMDEKLDG